MSQQHTITIIGGSGFIGSYIVKELAQTGAAIKIACRHPDRALYLKPAGRVGQIAPTYIDLTKADTITKAIEGSDYVINLVGLLFEKGKQDFASAHAKGPERLAKIAKEQGVKKFIHMSALGVGKHNKAKYTRTKAMGEKAVLAAFPEATIIRPSVVFGPEDNFFNQFAKMTAVSPFLPLIGGGTNQMQPVYVADVAKAFAAIIQKQGTEGIIYEIGGPTAYSFKALMELILTTIDKKRTLLPIPFIVAKFIAFFMEFMPTPLLTRDQVELLKTDNILDGSCPGLKELGITPTSVEAVLPAMLAYYRPYLSTVKHS